MNIEPPGLFDAGAQAERTALAWRRTALGVAVGGVVALRVTGPVLGAAAAVAAVAGSLLAAAAWWVTGRRYRAVQRSLHGRGDLGALARPAVPLVAVSTAATLIGALAVAFVLDRAT
jgi:putative membrane protein